MVLLFDVRKFESQQLRRSKSYRQSRVLLEVSTPEPLKIGIHHHTQRLECSQILRFSSEFQLGRKKHVLARSIVHRTEASAGSPGCAVCYCMYVRRVCPSACGCNVPKMLISFRRFRKLRMVPLISLCRCWGWLPYRPYIPIWIRCTSSLIPNVSYPTLVPMSDRRYDTWPSRGHGPTVGPQLRGKIANW